MRFVAAALTMLTFACSARGQTMPTTGPTTTGPTTAPAGKLPHVQVDVARRQVRVECESIPVATPLEFFCVKSGGPEHESVLRSPVKPSHLHLALLMLGLQPGEPVHYSEAAQKWLPPHGPPLRITLEWEKDGKLVSTPANRWMRDMKTKQEMPPLSWIFAGSRVMDDGNYAADVTGYLVSVVNFDLTVIDIPELASNANETLHWERNPDVAAPGGTKVTMIIEPVGDEGAATRPAQSSDVRQSEVQPNNGHWIDAQPAAARAPATRPSAISEIVADEKLIAELRGKWESSVLPHGAQLREAAQTHYEVLATLRREQQRLIDEADKIHRLIEDLEKRYQDLTTPRPEPVTP